MSARKRRDANPVAVDLQEGNPINAQRLKLLGRQHGGLKAGKTHAAQAQALALALVVVGQLLEGDNGPVARLAIMRKKQDDG